MNIILPGGEWIILKIYDKNDAEDWDKCVKSFHNWDVYYLYAYAYSFMVHGDGDIYLIYFEYSDERFCYVVMQKDIATCDRFKGILPQGVYFDWETPYGYGGPLTDGHISDKTQQVFFDEIMQYCKRNNIVSQFVRFHPLLKNYDVLPGVIETRYLRDTIFIDTSDFDTIIKNMDTKNRNMVRKAQKNNVSIICKDISTFQDFVLMYEETMKKNGADIYYSFNQYYYEALCNMKDNAMILYALYDNNPISGSIILFNDRYMHYHLSGSYAQYRKYSPNNLLLYKAACLACEKGIKRFHLGGGMNPDDSLFGFKKQFNKNGRAAYVVGRTIFDDGLYRKLLDIRKKADLEFDMNNNYMIQYRR